jgi:L-threonylcarbamoyladenylate synthase
VLVLDASGARSRSIVAAAAAARRGDVLLVPTESTYALATDAFSVRGVDAIRDLKDLSSRAPLAVMVPSATTLTGLALDVSDAARELSEAFWPGPLTLLVTPQPTLAWPLPSDALLAVRMPLHPVLLDLLAATGPLVVTGLGGSLPLIDEEALAALVPAEGVQVALDAGTLRTSVEPPSIVDVSEREPRLVREGALSRSVLARACSMLEHEADA